MTPSEPKKSAQPSAYRPLPAGPLPAPLQFSPLRKPFVERAFRAVNFRIEVLYDPASPASLVSRQFGLPEVVADGGGREFSSAEADQLLRSLLMRLQRPADPAGPETDGGEPSEPTP